MADDKVTNEFLAGLHDLIIMAERNGGKTPWSVNSLALARLADNHGISARDANTALERTWHQTFDPS